MAPEMLRAASRGAIQTWGMFFGSLIDIASSAEKMPQNSGILSSGAAWRRQKGRNRQVKLQVEVVV
jgi:hypothetical protein